MSPRSKISLIIVGGILVIGLLIFFFGPVLFASVAYPLPDNFQEPIAKRAQQYGLSPNTLAALTFVESGFNESAHSGAGAIGPTQFLPSTARGVANDLGVSAFSPSQLTQSPDLAEWFTAFYLSRDVKTYGSLRLALIAYNGGGGAAEASIHGFGFAGPDAYADKIIRIQAAYQAIYGSWWQNPTITQSTPTAPPVVQFNVQPNYSTDIIGTVPVTDIWQGLITGQTPTATNANSDTSTPGTINNLWKGLLPSSP